MDPVKRTCQYPASLKGLDGSTARTFCSRLETDLSPTQKRRSNIGCRAITLVISDAESAPVLSEGAEEAAPRATPIREMFALLRRAGGVGMDRRDDRSRTMIRPVVLPVLMKRGRGTADTPDWQTDGLAGSEE